MSEAVMLYSGGTDSTCVAGLLAETHERVHLLTFEELATRGTPVPRENVRRLRAKYGAERFVHRVVDVDALVERLSYVRYGRSLARHGLFMLSTCGFSSLSWHLAALGYCLEHGVTEAADGVTRELVHFPGHMDPVLAAFRDLYARFGVRYTNPVRDWAVPPDRRFLERMVVDRHAEVSRTIESLLREHGELVETPAPPPGTTGRWLHERGLMPAPNVKGTALDRRMQHDCYPFVLFNVFAFWLWLAWRDYASYERRMEALFRERAEDAAAEVEEWRRSGAGSLLGRTLAGARDAG